jgi:hypothetical protein
MWTICCTAVRSTIILGFKEKTDSLKQPEPAKPGRSTGYAPLLWASTTYSGA